MESSGDLVKMQLLIQGAWGGEAREPAYWRTLNLPVRTDLWLGLPYTMLPLAFEGLKVPCF